MMAMVVASMFRPVVVSIPMAWRRTMMMPPGWWTGRWLPVRPIDHRRRIVAVARAAVKGGHNAAEINPDIDSRLGLAGDEDGGRAAEQQSCKDVSCFHGCLRDSGIWVGPVHCPSSWGTACRRTRSLLRRLPCRAHCKTTVWALVDSTRQVCGLVERAGVISRVRQAISPNGFMGRYASRKSGRWKRVCSLVMCWTVTALRRQRQRTSGGLAPDTGPCRVHVGWESC